MYQQIRTFTYKHTIMMTGLYLTNNAMLYLQWKSVYWGILLPVPVMQKVQCDPNAILQYFPSAITHLYIACQSGNYYTANIHELCCTPSASYILCTLHGTPIKWQKVYIASLGRYATFLEMACLRFRESAPRNHCRNVPSKYERQNGGQA